MSTLKRFCQQHCLLLQSDENLGIGFKFAERSLSSGNRISIENFHGFVVQHAYLNVSSTNSEQCKLCVNDPLYIDARLLWKQAIGSNCP